MDLWSSVGKLIFERYLNLKILYLDLGGFEVINNMVGKEVLCWIRSIKLEWNIMSCSSN